MWLTTWYHNLWFTTWLIIITTYLTTIPVHIGSYRFDLGADMFNFHCDCTYNHPVSFNKNLSRVYFSRDITYFRCIVTLMCQIWHFSDTFIYVCGHPISLSQLIFV